jgi:multidrug efflux pump
MDESVVSLIEQELNGADNLLYFESQSSLGSATITATFQPGTNPDLAQVDVQNRLKVVESRLPRPVTQQGLQVEKVSTGFLLLATLTSSDGSLDETRCRHPGAQRDERDPPPQRASARPSCMAPNAPCASGSTRQADRFQPHARRCQRRHRAQNAQVSPGSIGDLPSPTQEITATLVKGQLSPRRVRRHRAAGQPDGSTVPSAMSRGSRSAARNTSSARA